MRPDATRNRPLTAWHRRQEADTALKVHLRPRRADGHAPAAFFFGAAFFFFFGASSSDASSSSSSSSSSSDPSSGPLSLSTTGLLRAALARRAGIFLSSGDASAAAAVTRAPSGTSSSLSLSAPPRPMAVNTWSVAQLRAHAEAPAVRALRAAQQPHARRDA